jgi:hypothetical protein
MSTIAVIQQEEQQFQTAIDKFKREAEAIVVATPQDCLAAKTLQRDVRDYMKRVHGAMDPFVDEAKSTWQKARDRINKWLLPAETVDETLKKKVQDYERREREAAEADTRRKNEEKRQAQLREAEDKRKAAEADAKRQRESVIADVEYRLKHKLIGKREAARLLRAAGAMEQAALQDAAAREEEDKAKPVEQVVVQPRIPTVQGVPTSRRPWRWEVVDEAKIPREFWQLNDLRINAIVRADKEKTNIPGIRAFQEP